MKMEFHTVRFRTIKKARTTRLYEKACTSSLKSRKRNQHLGLEDATVRAFHSRFIYGKPVETCRPYPRDYMKNAYEIVRFQYTIYL